MKIKIKQIFSIGLFTSITTGALTICCLLPHISYTQPGSLDNTFGTGGIVTTPIGSGDDAVYAVVQQSDGKIVMAGHSGGAFAIVRYNTNGTPDNTFGTGGIVTTAIGIGNAVINSIAIQGDGKIVAAGVTGIYPNLAFAIARYNTNGTLDNTFDTDGRVTTDIGTDQDRASSVVIQSDGKILVAGSTYSVNTDCALIRYNSDGSLDNNFDSDGIVTTVIGTVNDLFRSVAIQTDGKIVAAGFSYVTAANYQFLLTRYNSNGSLDNTFDSDGIVTTDIVSNTNDYGESVHIQSDGKIVLGGYSFTGSLCLVRYNSDGSYDNTFGINGKVNTPFGAAYPNDYSAALQGDGKILIGGYRNISSTNSDFGLARFTTAGMLDNTFGTGGIVTTPIGSGDDIGTSVVIQSDAKIVFAGKSFNGSNHDFAAVRYNNSINTGTSTIGDKAKEINIYPTVSTGIFNIEVNDKKSALLYIFNLLGEEVLRQQVLENRNLTLTQKGIYFVKIYDGENIYTKRIIIM